MIKAKIRAWKTSDIPRARTIAGVYVDGKKAAEYNRAFMVCGLSVGWDYIEYGAAVFSGKEKPVGFTIDPDFCEACSEIYNRANKKLSEYNASHGLNLSGEPLSNNLNKGDKNMKHNDFKGYLDDAKEIRERAIVSYNTICEEWEAARGEWNKAQHSGLSELDFTIEKAAFLQAEKTYKQALQDLRSDTKVKLLKVREELAHHTDVFYMADPSRLDANTMTLLNSDILSTKELEHLAGQNKGNPTMLRMIGKVAKDRLKNMPANETRDVQLSALANKLERIGSGEYELQIFDGVSEWVERCINPDPYFAKANNPHFDRIFGEYMQVMDGMTAQPEAPKE